MSRAGQQTAVALGAADVSSVLGAPLHDFPELTDANETFWGAVIERAGLPRPSGYTRNLAWNDLTLAQVDGYAYVTELATRARLVATPSYRARGADGPFLRSAVLVRANDPALGLADLRGRICAYDQADWASRNLLRAETAVLSREGGFFGAMSPQAGIVQAVNLVAQGEADAVLIDGAALAHVQRLHSVLASKLRLILWTARGPGAPFVTSAITASAQVLALRNALIDAIADPSLAGARAELLIRDIHPLPESQYRALLHFEQMARSQGYPDLR